STNYWWFVNGGEMFLYNDSSKALANLSNDKNYSASEELTQVSGNIMLQMHKSNRKESNYISITDTSNAVQNIDTKNVIADHISIIQKDTLLALQYQKGKLQVAYFKIKQQQKSSNYIFQQPFECNVQLALSNCNFLIQSNGEGWQVFDRTTHLMVYQENYSSYTNPQFLDIEGTNQFLLIKNNEFFLYEKGRWKKPKEKLLLQHPLIQEGDGLYASLLNIIGCMYNPSTKLLSVLTKKNKDWFALSFSTNNAFALMEVCKIPINSFSNKEGGSLYSSSLSVQEGLLLFALNQWKNGDWKKAANNFNDMKGSLKKFIQQTPEMYYEESVDEIHSKGGLIAKGLLINPFNGSTKIFDPYYKEQFPKAKLIKVEGNNAQYHFSSEGNYVIITLLESVTLYQVSNEKLSIAKLPKEEYYQPTINGRNYYLIEEDAILTAYEEWRTVDAFQLLYSKPEYYSLSNARLENNQLYLIPITGNKATLLNFNTLSLEPVNRIPAISTTKIPRDSLWGNYYPALKKWLLVNEKIAGLDTAHLYKDFTVGRLLTTQLKEIKWVQADTINNTAILSDLKNSFEYWDLKTETCLYRLYVLNEKDFFIETNNGYYYATPFALPSVCTVLNGNAIPSNLINTGLNRPDKVMQVLLGDNNPVYQQFAKAYLPFAVKQEKVPVLKEAATAPVILLSKAPANIISNASTNISFQLQSFNAPLKSAAVYINNVKVWDSTFNAIQNANIQLPVTLVDGENQLYLTCNDASNQWALPIIKRSYFQSTKSSSFKTYVITVGVSQYQDTSFNLVYAAKDAKDIIAAFRKATPNENLVTDSLLNQQATRTNLLALKQKLMQTKVEDKVIISFSGHGLLDSSRNFWFATHDMQFNKPAAKGFSFNEIENLLENIPARRKLILLDACNSGLADVAITDTSTSNANVVVQYNNANKKGIELGNVTRNLTSEQIQYLFSAGSNNSGAEIIAATGGNAFAFESAQYNNGIFTYALLQALQSNNDADKNFNKMLSVKELKRFIYPMVEKLTRGQQRPIARFENPNYDWDVLNEIDSYKY
ncbi:MAG: caspase family protein, partial [Ferruginibacter sp.]